jgi:EAL and modified HD-GYP domain-containing signal transduction protein
VAPAGIHDVFVGRQPIFDDQERLYSYELLYRAGAASDAADGMSRDQMCRDTVLHTLMSIGLTPITGGALAFVNLTRAFLVARLYELFDPKTVVIELLETVEPDAEVVAECERLVSIGYTLALDDFVNAPGYEPLLRLAKIVKVDVLGRDEAELRRVAEELRPYGVRLLAERVETADVRDRCRRLGYTLFQGYFYSRPQVVSHRELGVEQVAVVRLMNMLDDARATDAEIENAFKGDPSLSYKLLRIANSAAFGARGVASIGHALRLVGTQAIAPLADAAPRVDHRRAERRRARAGRCRRWRAAAGRAGGRAVGAAADAGPLFLTGLFSLLDALLRMPMDGVLAPMHIAPDVKAALLSRSGPYAAALALVEAQEHGDWARWTTRPPRWGSRRRAVSAAYTEALAWAAERLSGD